MFYLAAAFIAVWVVVTAYVLYMSNRQRQLEQESKSCKNYCKTRRIRNGFMITVLFDGQTPFKVAYTTNGSAQRLCAALKG